MHWIENALANVNLEALNDVLVWTIDTLEMFNLDVGSGNSLFEKTIPISEFSDAIFLLAYFIIIAGTIIKLLITMMSPFDTAESPGAIAVRFSGAMAGTILSQAIFRTIEGAFNNIYGRFLGVYNKKVQAYKTLPFNRESEDSTSPGVSGGETGSNKNKSLLDRIQDWIDSRPDVDPKTNGSGTVNTPEKAAADDSFNLFGGDNLIQESSEAGLGVLILELIIGCTLIISFFRLILEVYERYILIGLMYFTAPLAFASIISSGSKIFRSWFQMLISQFILMIANLIFIGGFIGAWYNIMDNMANGDHAGFVFATRQEYFTTMFALIGWLIIGQKFDQHLKGLGLSTAQTGAGLMGALAGGAVMARTALGAAGAAAGGIHKAAMGQTMGQKAYRNGDGLPGMLPGAGSAKDAGKGIGDKINDNVQGPKDAGSGAAGGGTPAPRTEGSNFNEAMNNAIRGSGKEGDQGTPIPAYNDPESRAGFNSEGIDWHASSAIPGAVEGYDAATDTTLIVGQTPDANSRLNDLYEGQLDATSVNGRPMLIHGASGNHVGVETPTSREGASPRDKRNLIDKKNK